MKLILDAQLPVKLCEILKQLGLESIHVDELPKGDETPDKEIIKFADLENESTTLHICHSRSKQPSAKATAHVLIVRAHLKKHLGKLNDFYKLIKASRFLPYQSIIAIIWIVAIPILLIKYFEGLTTNWIDIRPEIENYGKIQDRIKNKEPEYFFDVSFSFPVKGDVYEFNKEFGFSTPEEAEYQLNKIKNNSILIWYKDSNPNKIIFDIKEEANFMYLVAIIIGILVLWYIKWMLLKYYELELSEKKQTGPNKSV